MSARRTVGIYRSEEAGMCITNEVAESSYLQPVLVVEYTERSSVLPGQRVVYGPHDEMANGMSAAAAVAAILGGGFVHALALNAEDKGFVWKFVERYA